MANELRLEPQTLSEDYQRLHARAVAFAVQYRRSKSDLLDVIDEVERSRLIEALACGSTFGYCRDFLKLSEATALALVRLVRKGREVPEFREALREGLPFSKAIRICRVMTPENKDLWIERAKTLSKYDLERRVAEASPRAAESETVAASHGGRLRVEFFCDEEQRQILQRATDVLSNKKGAPASLEDMFLAAVEAFLDAECPVRRADRSHERANASVRVKVDHRDRGRCQMIGADGLRCGTERFVDHHHVRARFNGGTDEVDNFVTLCKRCHRLWHRQEEDVPLLVRSDSG